MRNKDFFLPILLLCFVLLLCGCDNRSLVSPKNPVTLTMWHVYGEQADSPMEQLIQEFNRTCGQDNGVFIKVTGLANNTSIGPLLREAQAGGSDVPELPDLFTAHVSDAAALGSDQILDWNSVLPEELLSDFVPGFLEDGLHGEQLLVLPLSKSTNVLMLSGSGFARFQAETGVTEEELATWDGFYEVARRYHEWSGRPFCAMDYPIRCVELQALAMGSGDFYRDEWYDFDNAILKQCWLTFARALIQGDIVLSQRFSNTQVMTGEVLAGLGSSAAILYYNDTVTYPDGTSYPMNLLTLPFPTVSGHDALMTQGGVGLCARQTTPQKAEAAVLFARWLTESARNLSFVTSSGYMPVKKDAFDSMEAQSLADASYEKLYETLQVMLEHYAPVSEPHFVGYYDRVNLLYEKLREQQPMLHRRFLAGECLEALAEETWELFRLLPSKQP